MSSQLIHQYKNQILILACTYQKVQAWNDHYDEEDDTWVLKVLLPILGCIILFCIAGCLYQHHIRKEAEANGTSDKDLEGTDKLPDNYEKSNPFLKNRNNLHNYETQNPQNNNLTKLPRAPGGGDNYNQHNLPAAKPTIGNLNIPSPIQPGRNYTQVNYNSNKIVPPGMNRTLSNYNASNYNPSTNNNSQNGNVYSIPRSQSYAFQTHPKHQINSGNNAGAYDLHQPKTVATAAAANNLPTIINDNQQQKVNRSTSVIQPNNNYPLMQKMSQNPNLPKRNNTMHGANYLTRPVASFQNSVNHPPNSEGIYIETGSSESNYSQVDGMNPNLHRQNLLPGHTVIAGRRGFRGRYGNNKISFWRV